MATQDTVAALLRQAEEAHGEYEAGELGGVFDERWPEWYATFLVNHGIGEHLPQAASIEHLSAFLTECDQAHRQEQPTADWADFYAQRLVATGE
jgi:hypothetical protein